MPREMAYKCDNCGCEDLVHDFGKLGKLNALLGNIGGPGQAPPVMGTQWAVYLCVACGAIFPYKKHYPGQPQVQAQFEKLWKLCKDVIDRRKAAEEAQHNAESVRQARQVTATLPTSLPGAPGSNENAISAVVGPLFQRLEFVEAELKRKRGGRPKKNREEIEE